MRRVTLSLALLLLVLVIPAAAEINQFQLVAKVISGTLTQPGGPHSVVGIEVETESGERLHVFCPVTIGGPAIFNACADVVLHQVGSVVFFRGELHEDPANGATSLIVTRLDTIATPAVELGAGHK